MPSFPGVDFLEFDSLLSDEEKLARKTARQFVDDQVLPVIVQHDREGTFPMQLVPQTGVNDRYQQALALADALTGGPAGSPPIFKVNLIPYNPTTAGPYSGSSRESIAAFRAVLESRGVPVTVRLTRGRDIDAACGQLAALSAAPATGVELVG